MMVTRTGKRFNALAAATAKPPPNNDNLWGWLRPEARGCVARPGDLSDAPRVPSAEPVSPEKARAIPPAALEIPESLACWRKSQSATRHLRKLSVVRAAGGSFGHPGCSMWLLIECCVKRHPDGVISG